MTIYLDNLAATPTDSRVAKRHCEAALRYPGNAHSAEHSLGLEADEAIAAAADTLLAAMGMGSRDVLFTPGASPALWLVVEDAIARTDGRLPHIAASAAEHPALLSALRRAERLGRVQLSIVAVDNAGAPRLEAIEKLLGEGLDLLCTMAANNEVGTVTELSAVRAMASGTGTRLLIDASQAAGKTPIAEIGDADLMVVSGAKIYGPRRTGALIGSLGPGAIDQARELLGSPDVAGAVALAFAMELRAAEGEVDEARLARLRDVLQARLLSCVPGLRINGDPKRRLSGSLHVSTPHLPGEAAVARLWGRVALSTGAACQSGVPGPSHVLAAMDLPEWVREGAVRIGLGRFNTDHEVTQAGELIAVALGAAEPVRRYA